MYCEFCPTAGTCGTCVADVQVEPTDEGDRIALARRYEFFRQQGVKPYAASRYARAEQWFDSVEWPWDYRDPTAHEAGRFRVTDDGENTELEQWTGCEWELIDRVPGSPDTMGADELRVWIADMLFNACPEAIGV